MVQPRPGQGNRRILSSAHPPLALSNALASIHRPIDVHENQYFRALMHDTQSSSRNRHGGSRFCFLVL